MVQDNDYLAHHGVKGMKWGIRRFQNADGTLTSLGKKHYGVGEQSREAKKKAREKNRVDKDKARAKAKEEKMEKKRARAEEKSAKRVIKATHDLANKKLLNKLSDEELKKVVARLELEKKYRDTMLAADPSKKKYFSWREQGAKVAANLIQKLTDKAIDSGVKKLFTSQEERETADLNRLKREKETLEVKRGILIARDKYKEYQEEEAKKKTAKQEVKDKEKQETTKKKRPSAADYFKSWSQKKAAKKSAKQASSSSSAKKGKKAVEKGLTQYQDWKVS